MREIINSVERTMRTLAFEPVDRVPVDLHNFLMTARMMEVDSFSDFFQDGEAMAEGQIKAWRRFGHDVLLVENGTAALAQACGVEIQYQSDSAPVAKKPAIKSLDEVNKLEQPEKIHQLLGFCRQASYHSAVAQIEQGAHATSIGDSTSGPDVISPKHYRSYAYPYVKQLVDDPKSKDIILAYHICGNSSPIIDDMVNSRADIIEIDQKADLHKSKQASAGKAALLGPVDPSEIMAKGTPDQVIEKCREAIDVLAPGGRFILGPGCALPATTPDENIDAMIETAKVYKPYATQ